MTIITGNPTEGDAEQGQTWIHYNSEKVEKSTWVEKVFHSEPFKLALYSGCLGKFHYAARNFAHPRVNAEILIGSHSPIGGKLKRKMFIDSWQFD